MRRLHSLPLAITMTLEIGGFCLPALRADSPSYCAALVHPGRGGPQLTLFPLVGPATTVLLPAGLSIGLHVNAFSRDGTAVYVQNAPPSDAVGIRKIEFKPLREHLVPGSTGLGSIWHMVESQAGKIFVSGVFSATRRGGAALSRLILAQERSGRC